MADRDVPYARIACQPARTAAGGPYRVNDRYLHDYLRPSDQRVPLPDSL